MNIFIKCTCTERVHTTGFPPVCAICSKIITLGGKFYNFDVPSALAFNLCARCLDLPPHHSTMKLKVERVPAQLTLAFGDQSHVVDSEEAKMLIQLLASTFPVEFDDVITQRRMLRAQAGLANQMARG